MAEQKDLQAHYKEMSLYDEIDKNINILKMLLKENSDINFRELTIGSKKIRGFLLNIDGMVDKEVVNEDILEPIMAETRKIEERIFTKKQVYETIRDHFIMEADVSEKSKIGEIVDGILEGNTALIIDGVDKGIIISTKGWPERSITEPTSESTIRGPKEGFVETLRVNTSMLRRRIKNPNFIIESMKIGKYTKTDVVIAYIKDIAEDKVIKEVRKRLNKIDIDAVMDTGYLEEFIEDNPFSPFPQIEHTLRPDKVAAEILEGRVAVMSDGSPYALLVPTVFIQFLQASEDYYERYPISSFLRILRMISMFIALLLPSIYIAVTTYHQEMLPAPLIISCASQRENVPFPGLLEVMFLEFFFEMLREASVRLPMQMGQAVSIVGALVIGQAAVQAGLVSASMVIVVAMAGIASFSIPAFNLAITFRMLRFIMLFAAGTLGFFGIIMVLMVILVHMVSLESFGVPYMSPIAPGRSEELKDVFVRAPWWWKALRPFSIADKNVVKQRRKR
jgi:spore germination protein KA